MPRFFAPPEDWVSNGVLLREEEARHAIRVLRLRQGKRCEVFDGEGRSVTGCVGEKQGTGLRIEHDGRVRVDPVSGAEVVLVTAIAKGRTMDWILEKATELSVSRIVAVVTERTVVRLDAAGCLEKEVRWRRDLVEACKQCGRNRLPELRVVRGLGEALQMTAGCGLRVFGALDDRSRRIREVVGSGGGVGGVAAFIGPEGDFTAEEGVELRGAGVQPVGFGSLVLRMETAVVYAVSVLKEMCL